MPSWPGSPDPAFADRTRHEEHERTPGVLVVRCESALLYFNVEHVRERILHLFASRPEPLRLVILSLGSVPRVDLAGATLIAELHRTLAARGVGLRLAEAHGPVRDALRRIGFERVHGTLEAGQTVHTILAEWDHAAA